MENNQLFPQAEYQMYKAARTFAKLCINTYKQFPKTILFRDQKVQTAAKSLEDSWAHEDMQPITSLVEFDLDKDSSPHSLIYTPWGHWRFAKLSFYRNQDCQIVSDLMHQHIQYKKYECKYTNAFKIASIDGKPVIDLERPAEPLTKKAKEIIDGEARNKWKAMTQQYRFEKETLKKLCLKFIRKNKEQLQESFAILPTDLQEALQSKK